MSNSIDFVKQGVINPEKVKNAVYNRIDFELSEELWDKINDAFAYF